MENRQTSRQITVGERTFEVKKMDPRTACWLCTTLAARADSGTMMNALGKLPREEYTVIESEALRRVYFLDDKEGNTFPTPIIGASGVVTLPLEADELMKLLAESLAFSLSPFLVGPESNSLNNQK